MSVTTLERAVTRCSLVGAAVIVTSGSLADVFGRKRAFQLGLMLLVASCILIAIAQSGGVVIAERVIQGAAGATILVSGPSLLSGANQERHSIEPCRGGGSGRPAAGWRARRHHRVAGAVLDRRRCGTGVHGVDRREHDRVPGPPTAHGRSTTPARCSSR